MQNKSIMPINSYINSKGYVILKNSLPEKVLKNIKNDLSVSPKDAHFIKGPKQEKNTITVYRENDKKIYIPRFYGLNKIGITNTEIPSGHSINVPFVNELRDYQKKIVGIYLNHVKDGFGGGILEVPCGRGKTIMALNILSRLQKKTLIIVHKEFLMNQWIERINDFVPSAKVGKIQGRTFDIEEKDIVIGMIQTMYHREYEANAFSSFGLTILDEVHRVGSEEFSKTLLKVVTPYMLGISATVDRKDGLTELLYMFIGPKIYSEKTKDTIGVEVRAIEYDHMHEEYKKEELDFRGNIKYSTMINNISDFNPRRIFIMKILQDLISEDNKKQIIVLSHKRDLLDHIYDETNRLNFATCGKYVGGMKQNDLKTSEEMQIVLATYSMAAEALDIKSLNTLVMVSPKTDIIQSVGRILRTKCDGKIIVDIIDSHDIFQYQWKKRRVYYKKSNYNINMIKSEAYVNMLNTEWKHYFKRNDEISVEKEVCELDY